MTTIRFDLPAAGPIDLAVYDVTGRRVRTLVSGALNAGSHDVIWWGRDDTGGELASGLYFYKMQTDEKTLTRKMLLLK